MPSVAQSSLDDLLPAAKVLKRYSVSDMTLYRWLTNPKLDFPAPIRINNRRYWRLGDLQAFEAGQAFRSEAA